MTATAIASSTEAGVLVAHHFHFQPLQKEVRTIIGRGSQSPTITIPTGESSSCLLIQQQLISIETPYQRLNYHLERLNKISDNQSGFRERRSKELAIRHLIQKIIEGQKKNPHVMVLSIDIKGTFDNIQHFSIVYYLDNSNCSQNISTIFRNLLLYRKIILNSSERPAIIKSEDVLPTGFLQWSSPLELSRKRNSAGNLARKHSHTSFRR
ncbi:hypothetical protein AVEN_120226-1 [Araneus ventricosus]|uniref:Reverse transcriptase domain-containing protein n=1 Tax=Araneus ventricosus TaxID=182803 RepID=A0A4Y2J4V6_ARAVE|nr:hypothetical protein AVEN_120226-1 [Araneus ventricosus]